MVFVCICGSARQRSVMCLGAGLLTVGAFCLQLEFFCLRWGSASSKHLNEGVFIGGGFGSGWY